MLIRLVLLILFIFIPNTGRADGLLPPPARSADAPRYVAPGGAMIDSGVGVLIPGALLIGFGSWQMAANLHGDKLSGIPVVIGGCLTASGILHVLIGSILIENGVHKNRKASAGIR